MMNPQYFEFRLTGSQSRDNYVEEELEMPNDLETMMNAIYE